MKQEIAELWASRLPAYKKTRGALCSGDAYCCLGVLCELAIEAGVPLKKNKQSSSSHLVSYGDADGGVGDFSVLPTVVREWAGIRFSQGELPDKSTLSGRNDAGESFTDLAIRIRRNWEVL